MGRESGNGNTPIVISARTSRTATATTDLAFGPITVGGGVSLVNFEAGFGVTVSATNGNAQTGAVRVTGNWLASNLVAGVENYGANHNRGDFDDNLNFGNSDDHLIGNAGSISKIASITIGGIVAGSFASADHYGFAAHRIGAFKYAGFSAALHPTTPLDVIDLSLTTGDVTLREV